MKALIGVLLMVAGVLLGLYAGVWWAFIGGIVDVITEIRSADMSAMNIAIGVAKVMFAGVIGWVVGAIAVFPGYALFESD